MPQEEAWGSGGGWGPTVRGERGAEGRGWAGSVEMLSEG